MTANAAFPRWLMFLVVALALIGGALGAWWLWRPEGPAPVTLWYGDQQAMYVVPVHTALALPAEPEPWARAVFEKLALSPDPALVAVVGPEVKLLKARWQSPVWSLEVGLANSDGSALERLMVASIVRSFLASYPGAERVELRLMSADGKPYESQHLDLSRPLQSADVANRLDGPKGALTATFWWRLPGASQLVPIQAPLTGQNGSPPADALARLVAGPPAEATAFVGGVVPAGLHPHWGGLEGEVAAVSLDQPVPDSADGRRFVEAAVLTLTEMPGVKAVRFKQGQQPATGAVGPYQLSAPIERPVMFNAVPETAWAAPARP